MADAVGFAAWQPRGWLQRGGRAGGARAGTARLRGGRAGGRWGPRRGRHVAGGGPAGEPGVGGLGGGAGPAPRRLADGVMRARNAKVVQVPRWRR